MIDHARHVRQASHVRPTRWRSAAASLFALGLSARASAQPPAPATSGSTEVATSGFQAVAKPPAPEDAKDGTQLKLTAGGLLTQGNSRTIAATASGDFRLRRNVSQFTALAAVNYGRSAPAGDGPYETTVENYQGKVRYDYFFAPGVAGFLSVSARRDRFQGLDLRLNLDPGVAYYFIDEKTQQFWLELGYDLQHDIRRDEFVDAAAAAGDPIDKSETSHGIRGFVGYNYALNETLAFNAGIEYLQSVEEGNDARVNGDVGLTTKVSKTFSIAVTVSVRYDNDPLEGVDKTDLLSALSLVYSLAE
jgi:putative salt-induced outer membrane protein YdiY